MPLLAKSLWRIVNMRRYSFVVNAHLRCGIDDRCVREYMIVRLVTFGAAAHDDATTSSDGYRQHHGVRVAQVARSSARFHIPLGRPSIPLLHKAGLAQIHRDGAVLFLDRRMDGRTERLREMHLATAFRKGLATSNRLLPPSQTLQRHLCWRNRQRFD